MEALQIFKNILKHIKIVFYFTLQVAAVSVDVGVDVPSVAKHVANVVAAVHAVSDPHLHVPISVEPVQILSSTEGDPHAVAAPHLLQVPASQVSELPLHVVQHAPVE